MSGHITWGVTRALEGPALKTVFCMQCREVFARSLMCPVDAIEAKRNAESSHKCRGSENG